MIEFETRQEQIEELKLAALMIVIALTGSFVFIVVAAYTVARWWLA